MEGKILNVLYTKKLEYEKKSIYNQNNLMRAKYRY